MKTQSGCDQHVADSSSNQPEDGNDLKLLKLDEFLDNAYADGSSDGGY